MGSDSVSGAADTATKVVNVLISSHAKRKRVSCQDKDAITLALGVKRRRADSTILQLLDNNIRLREEATMPKAIPPSFLDGSHLLRKFEYSESEIRILEVIGSGDHAVVYRIAAGGRTFALKVHKYANKVIEIRHTQTKHFLRDRTSRVLSTFPP